MQVYLRREGIVISRPTVHRYMNRELGLLAVVRRRKPNYCKGHAHKIFPNLLQQNFTAEEIISGALILRIYFLAMAASGITVRLLTFMIAV